MGYFTPFARSITQNPLLMAFIVLLYVLIVFIAGLVAKVWQKPESVLVDHFSDQATLWLQGVLSRYRKIYCEHLTYENQVFDVKGLSTRTAHDLELEQVFVELSFDSTPAHQTSADPLSVPANLREGEHSIWDYLSSSTSLGNPHLVIIGAPGSGKTTLLKHIALTLAKQKKGFPLANLSQTLPLLLFLRDQISSLQDNSDFSLVDAIQNHIQRKWHSSIPSSWIEHHLAQGKCLVLLDGLDEVADAVSRRQVVEWVQQQMVAYGKNRFLLTSRPYGYRDNPLDGVTVLEVHPFKPKQIERFIQRWYLANELKSWGKEDPGVHLRAREGAEDLRQRLQRVPALLELAVNPLLLTMIATVHRFRSSLPGKRIALYAEICEVFLGKRQEARGITQELTASQKQQVLQPLAYALMQHGVREITQEDAVQIIAPHLAFVSAQMEPKNFLQTVENTSGVLLERNPGIYGFAHLTFQEYLAAVHIKEEGNGQILVACVGDSWWHETIRLYCAQSDATAIIAACLRENPPSISALILAVECQLEAHKIQPEVRTQLETLLEQGMEDMDSERRRLVAEVLLTRRMREMVPLSETVYKDTSLITCAEYQLFLDEQQIQGFFHQPDHWPKTRFSSGKGRMPILGIRQADAMAFCQWLNARDVGGWHYRLPQESECERKEEGQEQTTEIQKEGIGIWTSQEREFFWLKPPPYFTNEKTRQLYIQDFTLLLTCAFIGIFTYARALAGVLAHNLARDFDHDLARDLARDLTHALAFSHTLARDLDLDLDLARDFALAHDLTHAPDLDRTRAQVLANTQELASNLDLVNDLAQDLDRARVLARGLAQDLDLASAHGLDFDFDFASALAHNFASALVSTHALYLARDLNSDLDLASINNLANTYPLDLNLTSTLANTYASDLVRDLAGALASTRPFDFDTVSDINSVLASTRPFDFDTISTLTENIIRYVSDRNRTVQSTDQMKETQLFRLHIRWSALTLALVLRTEFLNKNSSQLWGARFLNRKKNQSHEDEVIQQVYENLLFFYRDFAFLELRIQGKLPAWEGILLVKERKIEIGK